MKRQQGFTLIEVIVVIIMIGVLAAVAIPIYSGYVYRARASEGVVFLGTIKTYAMEYRTSRGIWPTLDTLNTEFHSFTELYYFNKTPAIYVDGDRFAIRLTAAEPFGLPDGFLNPYMQVDISLLPTTGDTGWSGGIVSEYAKHLPPCTAPLSS